MPQTHPEKLFAEVWQASPDELGAVTVKGSLSMTTPCLLGAIVQADSIMISCSKLLRAYVEDFNSDVVFIVRNADLPVKYLTHVLNLVCQHRPGLRVLIWNLVGRDVISFGSDHWLLKNSAWCQGCSWKTR